MAHSYKSTPAIAWSLFKLALPMKKGTWSGLNLGDSLVRQEGLALDPGLLARYRDVCELDAHASIPVLFPQVLAGPLQLALLAKQALPFSLLGAVHQRNMIEQSAPIDPQRSVNLEVRFSRMRVLEKGVELELETSLEQLGSTIWKSHSVFFVQGRFPEGGEPELPAPGWSPLSIESMQPVAQWHLAKNKGKRFARLSGDFNPIHISKMAARLFGFERDLIHGLCVFASALERVSETSSKAMDSALQNGREKIITTVHFKGPNYLDRELELFAETEENRSRMDLLCGDNPRPTLQAEVVFV